MMMTASDNNNDGDVSIVLRWELPPHAKGRNTVGQQLPTLLRPFAHPAVCCCMLLSVVESCCAKFETSETFEICPSLHAVAKIASADLDISGFLTETHAI